MQKQTKWFHTSFTREHHCKTKDWNGFVLMFWERDCKIPKRLKNKGAAITPNRMDKDLKAMKILMTDMSSLLAKQAEDQKQMVELLVGRIEHLKTSNSDLHVTVQKETI